MKYDAELCERLIADARKDDEAMTEAPWTVSNTPAVFKSVPYEANISRWYKITSATVTLDDAIGITRTRNNLRAMADQLEAARVEVERLTAQNDLRGQTVADLAHELGTVKGQCDLMLPVVEAAERYRDHGPAYAGIMPAVDAYRAARDKAGAK